MLGGCGNCECDIGSFVSGYNLVDHWYGLWKHVARVAISEISFLHVLCVSALITSSLFIGFQHISNEWKA
jgi:hypothetical protein